MQPFLLTYSMGGVGFMEAKAAMRAASVLFSKSPLLSNLKVSISSPRANAYLASYVSSVCNKSNKKWPKMAKNAQKSGILRKNTYCS